MVNTNYVKYVHTAPNTGECEYAGVEIVCTCTLTNYLLVKLQTQGWVSSGIKLFKLEKTGNSGIKWKKLE